MRFHILGVPHTVTNKEYTSCAYTQKVLKFAKMMGGDHEIFHYGHPDSNVLGATEHISVISKEIYNDVYGDHDHHSKFFEFDMEDKAYQEFYKNAIKEIGRRKQPNDFLLAFWGFGHKPICDAHQDMLIVEPGIGYASGYFAPYKIFESYAIYHAYLGLENVQACDPKWYDIVIPNYFDLEDFEFKEKKDDYLLFLGRIFEGKGINIAVQVAEQTGIPLKIAGQNSESLNLYKLPGNIEIVGHANAEQRKELMSGAKGFWLASQYVEPFGGTMIESFLSGTPVISTDWGSMAENNLHGITGYRCRTFEQFIWAAKNIQNLNPLNCRNWGENFSLERVKTRYEEYFNQILNLQRPKGWYSLNEKRCDLGWLTMNYPSLDFKTETGAFKPGLKIETFDWITTEEKTTFDENLADWIAEELNPLSVGDIGCGPGHFVKVLRAKNVQATGYDIEITNENISSFADITKSPIDKKEVIVCLEIAEHIDESYSRKIVKNITNSIEKGGFLIWSAAVSGQGGLKRIHCQPVEHWVKLFEEEGLVLDENKYSSLMNHIEKGLRMSWFVNNARVFKKVS